VEEFALTPDDPAYFYPFLYNSDEFPDLQQFITAAIWRPDGELAAWARNFLDDEARPDVQILSGRPMASATRFSYRKRHEQAPSIRSTPADRVRHLPRLRALDDRGAATLGIAARFVSGYLFLAGDRVNGYLGARLDARLGAGLLPSAGWIEFDPTNGIVGSRDLIRVAVARDPRQAIPCMASISGRPTRSADGGEH